MLLVVNRLEETDPVPDADELGKGGPPDVKVINPVPLSDDKPVEAAALDIAIHVVALPSLPG